MDKECFFLCKAINKIPGIGTVDSCYGHGDHTFRIFFHASSLEHLPILLYYLDPCHVGFRWWCKVTTDCSMAPATFRIESVAMGEEAYKQAQTIADKIEEYLKEEK